ncbi:MAG TPA: histidine phosphatase family protein [Chloroflexia bacterium]|jgi:probable phosphoglycerate mutase
MTTFLLVRHASHALLKRTLVGRTPGVPLDEAGREQAVRLAERLAHLKPLALYSSPVQRAMETAAPLSERWGLPVQIAGEFTEIDFGEWAGREFNDLNGLQQWEYFNSYRSGTRPSGGELMLEVQTRAVVGLQRLHTEYPNSLIAIVSHGDVIRAALNYYLGASLDLFRRLEVSPASVSILELQDWGPHILLVNHLGDLPQLP